MNERLSWTKRLAALVATLGFPVAMGEFTRLYFAHEPIGALPFSYQRWLILKTQLAGSDVIEWYFAAVVFSATLGAALIGWRERPLATSLERAACANLWMFGLLGHYVLLLVSGLMPDRLAAGVYLVTPMVVCIVLGGWMASLIGAAARPRSPDAPVRWRHLVCATACYVIVFGVMNVSQYVALNTPHGDTAMYEEHLWNVLSGKGFRSQLDDGRLFLGEHFQIVHLILIPVYWLAPTLPTLNICETLSLASGAVAVCWLARQAALPGPAAWALATAYLLYFPLHYLDSELSWKTFRPTAFGVPLVLFCLCAAHARRWVWTTVLAALCLTVKEEWALVVAGIGVYLLIWPTDEQRSTRVIGAALAVFATVWLVLVVEFLIPYYRGGAPHFSPYFSLLQSDPVAAFENLLSMENLWFAVLMLGPLCFLPLLSTRVLVSIPIFAYLMLGDPGRHLNEPWFHFHAPLIPLLFWAAAGGISNVQRWISPTSLTRLVLCVCLTTAVWFGRTPLSWKFYDPLDGTPQKPWGPLTLWEPRGSYWRDLYLPDERSAAFAKAAAVVRPTDRVAATDYVRARFTHCRAAHDYPTLRAHVGIEDLDVIVLDKTEGWWGRGSTNPHQNLLACMLDPACTVGTRITVAERPFEVVYHDDYFLVVRRRSDNS